MQKLDFIVPTFKEEDNLVIGILSLGLVKNLSLDKSVLFVLHFKCNLCHVSTVPCQPTQLNVLGSCDNNTVLLNWDDSRGASSYMVLISGNLGYGDSFQTSESILEVELLCGQTYTITTVGQNDLCDSIESDPVQFTSGKIGHNHE